MAAVYGGLFSISTPYYNLESDLGIRTAGTWLLHIDKLVLQKMTLGDALFIIAAAGTALPIHRRFTLLAASPLQRNANVP
jgi:hypothetical protein